MPCFLGAKIFILGAITWDYCPKMLYKGPVIYDFPEKMHKIPEKMQHFRGKMGEIRGKMRDFCLFFYIHIIDI
jgi:hypothetical protein